MNAKAIALGALPLLGLMLFAGRARTPSRPRQPPAPKPTPEPPRRVQWPEIDRIAQGWRLPPGWWSVSFDPVEAEGVNAQLQRNAGRVRIERVSGDAASGYAVLFEVTAEPGALWTLLKLPEAAAPPQ